MDKDNLEIWKGQEITKALFDLCRLEMEQAKVKALESVNYQNPEPCQVSALRTQYEKGRYDFAEMILNMEAGNE